MPSAPPWPRPARKKRSGSNPVKPFIAERPSNRLRGPPPPSSFHQKGEAMHPSVHAQANPDKAAVIVAETGETWSYADLARASNRVAQLFRARGLGVVATVALSLDNFPEYFALTWGAQRSGLFYVCISSKLTAPEACYIVEDSGAKLVVASAALGRVVEQLAPMLGNRGKLVLGGDVPGWERLEDALAAQPEDPNPAAPNVPMQLAAGLYGFSADSIYLSPAPMYHAAPLRWSMTVHRLGGTVVMMQHFDPLAALK